MAGRFEELSYAERKLSEDIFPVQGCGMPAVHPRSILNSPLFMPTVGCRRCGLPQGRQRASESSARRRLKAWHPNGILNDLKDGLLGAARSEGLICWNSGAFDGFFPQGKEAELKSDTDTKKKVF